MEEIELLSVKDLAKRWKRDEGTIRRYVNEGVISPCTGVPGMMFHPSYIAKLEGVEIERFSPLEKIRLKKEVMELKEKVNRLSVLLRKYQIINIESMDLLAQVD